jgi:hypothetical protein
VSIEFRIVAKEQESVHNEPVSGLLAGFLAIDLAQDAPLQLARAGFSFTLEKGIPGGSQEVESP